MIRLQCKSCTESQSKWIIIHKAHNQSPNLAEAENHQASWWHHFRVQIYIDQEVLGKPSYWY